MTEVLNCYVVYRASLLYRFVRDIAKVRSAVVNQITLYPFFIHLGMGQVTFLGRKETQARLLYS